MSYAHYIYITCIIRVYIYIVMSFSLRFATSPYLYYVASMSLKLAFCCALQMLDYNSKLSP